MSAIFTKRLTKELKEFSTNGLPGISLHEEPHDLSRWLIKIEGASETIYAGETFILQFHFSQQYPLDSPEVIFISNVPMHPHVYSNGHICLSILYDQWTPAMSVRSVCLSIQSMLSSAKTKERPPDNDSYVKNAKKSPKDTAWAFHDDSI